MEASVNNSDAFRGSSVSSSHSRRYGMQLSVSHFFHSPLSTLLEYSGILRPSSTHRQSDGLINSGISAGSQDHGQNDSAVTSNGGEVSIRIIGAGEQDHDLNRGGTVFPSSTIGFVREATAQNQVFVHPIGRTASAASFSLAHDDQGESRSDQEAGESVSQSLNGGSVDGEGVDVSGSNRRDSPYQRYDIQQAARWIEQVLPFSLLLLVVFIRQHLQARQVFPSAGGEENLCSHCHFFDILASRDRCVLVVSE
ncbi:RING-type E3 ubiquitin transferase [Sarracenia purpurea var. burkii]